MKLIKPTQINEYNETKADKIIETVFIVGLSALLIILSVLILSTTAKAAENSDNFPYAFTTYKGNIPDSIINVVISDFRSASGYQGDDFIIFATDTNWTSIYFKVIINPCFNKPDNINEYSYSSSYYPIYSYDNYSQYNFWYRPDNSAHGQYGSPTANTGYNFGGDTTSTISFFYTWYPHYPVYMGSDFVYNRFDINTPSETYDNIGIYKSELPTPVVPIVPTGHATEPNIDDNNNITADGTATQPNTPTFPIWVAPTIDTTSLETLVESLIDTVNDFADYVGECFSVFFSWLVGVLKNGLQSIVNEIRDLGQFLYNNFVSLFESISESVTYAIEPVDKDSVIDAFEDTNVYGIYSDFTTFNTTFDGAFNIQEPDSFTITIHVEDIDILNQQNPYILNLGANFYPIRSALRTFLWILVTFASVFFVEHNLSSWLKGSGEEK